MKQKIRIKKGDRFSHLVATGVFISNTVGGNRKYEVKCDCGNVITTLGISLKNGKKTTCNIDGCEFSKKINHGLSKTKEHNAWIAMKQRCSNKKQTSYAYYGGIGIKVSDEFTNSFTAFYEHIGECPSVDMSLDRIDVSKGYERGNIKWSTKSEQSNNQRRVNDLTNEIIRLKKLLDENSIEY